MDRILKLFQSYSSARPKWGTGVCIFFIGWVGISPAFAQNSCVYLLNKKGRQTQEFQWNGHSVAYTWNPQPQKLIHIERDLPELKNDFLIAFDQAGGISFWYQGVRIESRDRGNWLMKHSIGDRPTLRGASVIFAIQDLPEGYAEEFRLSLLGYQPPFKLNCTTAACTFLYEFDVVNVSRSILKKNLIRDLLNLKVKKKSEISIHVFGKKSEGATSFFIRNSDSIR